MTPLWGAKGKDSQGNNVHLGMIAGALVNEKDISDSIFTPDVKFSSSNTDGDGIIFCSSLPQALSTEAEMMTKYGEAESIDGKKNCIQRIHVTGGTNGILIQALREYRPFTPTNIGRAEDQSYILSVLFNENSSGYLRYVHKDGLIMRHDKQAFAGEAIKAGHLGKLIGDYIRIILFSFYADALPWDIDRIKDAVDPFTGCFISKIPITVVFLRFALKTAVFFQSDIKNEEGAAFFKEGILRIYEMAEDFKSGDNPQIGRYEREKKGWDIYYNILEKIDEKISAGDPFSEKLREKAGSIIEDCRLRF